MFFPQNIKSIDCLLPGYEEAMKKREHEFRVQADEMSTTMLAHEIKVISSDDGTV